MIYKFILSFFNCLFFINVGICQTISTKTREFAHEFLWKEGCFYPRHDSFKSTNTAYFIEFLDSNKFNNMNIKIYIFGARISHSKKKILIEKIHKTRSDYAVIGNKNTLKEIETMYLFFDKYSFSERLRNKCYEMLIDNYVFRSYFNQDELKEDSLFSEHR